MHLCQGHPDQLGHFLINLFELHPRVWSEGTAQAIALVMLVGTMVGALLLSIWSGFLRREDNVLTSKSPGPVMRWTWPAVVATLHLWSLGVLLLPGLFYLTPKLPVIVPGLVQGLGVVLWASSGMIILWSTQVMGRAMRPQVLVSREQQLVTRGPFRWVRHPVYAGNIIVGLGMALTFLSIPCLLLTIIASMIALRRTYIEEEMLSSPLAFGTEYERYRACTGRFLPRRSR